MILELDLGNTRCKWRLLDAAGNAAARGDGLVAQWLAGELPAAWQVSIHRVRGASVVSPEREAALGVQLESLEAPLAWARSVAECAGVRNGYEQPGRLGVDRWLAMLAAFRQVGGAVLVVDIGSALTLDLVDDTGLHRGGYIIPGPRLMAEALVQSTDRVRFEPRAESASIEPGLDTAACVENGIVLAAAGAVVLAERQAAPRMGPLTTMVAGGHAGALAELLAAAGLPGCRVCPELVLDGLRWALPEPDEQ